MKKIIFILLVWLPIVGGAQGFLHRDHQKIVDGKGQNIVLRGLCLGGWMVQEGYMLKTGNFAGPQYKIKEKIIEVIGNEATEKFYQTYKDNGITKKDIDSLAAWGFNSVRLPMHYNLYTPAIENEKNGEITWLEEGFKRTDALLKWCEANKIYLILDLHAAPGGQGKDAAISDYDGSKPSLWESAANRNKMIAFWKKIAERYKDNPWVGAYDIINEPNWNFTGTNANGCDEASNGPLRSLLMETTQAIRAIDKNHLIFIEGNCWGNNYNGIFPLWDDNLALSFHKYWNTNDQASIQTMLDYRTQYDVPIWLGESGENSNVWFKEAISLVEQNNIGWAFWPMKKIESIAGVTSVTQPKGYQQLLEYWKDGKSKPSPAFAKKVLMELANNYKLEKVTIRPDVVDAMFRQVQNPTAKAFKKHLLPARILAANYDLGTQGVAYYDTDFQNIDGTKFTPYNKGFSLRNDGVDIIPSSNKESNGFQVGFIEAGEWLQYTVTSKKKATYSVSITYASATTEGQVHLFFGNNKKTESVLLPATGNNDKYSTVTISNIALEKGDTPIQVVFEKGGIHFTYLQFKIMN